MSLMACNFCICSPKRAYKFTTIYRHLQADFYCLTLYDSHNDGKFVQLPSRQLNQPGAQIHAHGTTDALDAAIAFV